jgi:hypothetical protein
VRTRKPSRIYRSQSLALTALVHAVAMASRSGLTSLILSLLISATEAKLPFNSKISSPKLTGKDSISFDPLGVIATLPNLRADDSAARLYSQLDHDSYRWPHTMMLGSVLTPLQVLVVHLTSKYTSIHPATNMCLLNAKSIRIKSNLIFQKLSLDFSNTWLRDIIAFKASKQPPKHGFQSPGDWQIHHKIVKPPKIGVPPVDTSPNDFMIVSIINVFGTQRSPKSHPAKILLDLIGLLTGLTVMTGVIFSVLTGDIWATVLFLLYTIHWMASTMISFTTMVVPNTVPITSLNDDIKTSFAIHEREQGGSVIFKAEKKVLEQWARMTWKFDETETYKLVLHWAWIISGTLSATASVACMVNMTTYMQLGFLGVLFYSTIAEIAATQIARNLQQKTRDFGKVELLTDNESRTESIIRSCLETNGECTLEELKWIDLKLLPDLPEFRAMFALLDDLNGRGPSKKKVPFELAMDTFVGNTTGLKQDLIERIKKEVIGSWYRRESSNRTVRKEMTGVAFKV